MEDSGEFSEDKRWHTQQSSKVGSKVPKLQSAEVKVPACGTALNADIHVYLI